MKLEHRKRDYYDFIGTPVIKLHKDPSLARDFTDIK